MNEEVSSVIDGTEALLATGRYDRAAAMVLQGLTQMPESGILHSQHSRVLAAAEKWSAALDAARRAVELDPHEPLCWYRLAVSFAGNDDLPAAESAARNGLDLAGSEWAEGFHLLACSLLDQGGTERLLEAERLMLKCIELSPLDANYRCTFACIAAARGDDHEAGLRVVTGLAIDPLHADLLLMHAENAVRPSGGRVRTLVELLHLDPLNAAGHANLAAEYWRTRRQVQMAWWLLCVFDSFLMMWVPQGPYPILVAFTWLALIPVRWANGGARRALPKGYARRMSRRYPAAAWAGRITICASVSTPFLTIGLYGDHGEVIGNVVVSAVLVLAAVAYGTFRWLLVDARRHSPEGSGRRLQGVEVPLSEDATEVIAATAAVLALGGLLGWLGLGGPQPAAVGIFLLTGSAGCVWWWIAMHFAYPVRRLLEPPNVQRGLFLFICISSALLLAMIAAGISLAIGHDFALIP